VDTAYNYEVHAARCGDLIGGAAGIVPLKYLGEADGGAFISRKV